MTTAALARYEANYQPPTMPGDQARSGNMNGLARTFTYWIVGTMGLITPQALEKVNRNATSLTPLHYEFEQSQGGQPVALELERTPAQNLARVREVLRPAVLELANLFGVSRQSVYAWQDGAQPSAETSARLALLAQAADVFAEAGINVDAKTLRRKVAGGRTVLDAVLSGNDAAQVAKALVPTLQREAAQRERLAVQLAGRKRESVNVDDYGTPAVSEDV
jgi:transcriptional regulator with XRE-family HTH domain